MSSIIFPERIELCCWANWFSVLNGGTITRTVQSTIYSGAYVTQGTVAINDEIRYMVLLAAGTWKMTMIHYRNSDRGIYTHKLDSTTIGTSDGYNAGAATTVSSISGIIVAATANYTHSLVMASKHASSTNYKYAPAWITWQKTA